MTHAKHIFIHGKSRMFAELIASHLSEKRYSCTLIADMPDLVSHLSAPLEKTIILCDYDIFSYDDMKEWPGRIALHGVTNILFVLFNVENEALIERRYVDHLVYGLFLKDDSLERLQQGIDEVWAGSTWFSRKLLHRLLHQKNDATAGGQGLADPLTGRERQILLLLMEGMDNKNISYRLGISLHTVKSHIQRLFKKINVDNRLQAAFWAATYLHG